jgi:hypothetical protein
MVPLPPGNFPLVSKRNSHKTFQGFKTSKSKVSSTENTFIRTFLLQALNQNKMLLIRDRVIEWLVNYISGLSKIRCCFVNKLQLS